MLKNFALTTALFCVAQPAFAGDVNKLLNYVPADAGIVMTLDLDNLRTSALKGLFDMASGMLKASPDYAQVSQMLSFDPLTQLKALSFYMPKDAKGDDQFCILVQGPFNASTFPNIIQMLGGEAPKKHTVKGTDIYSADDGALALVGDVAFMCNSTMIDAAISSPAKLAKADGIHKAALASASSNILTLSATIGDEQGKMIAQMTGEEAGVRGGTIALSPNGQDLKLVATGRFANEKTATEMKSTLQQQLDGALADPSMAQFGITKDDFKLTQAKKTVAFQANIKSSLITMASGLISMMLSGQNQ